MRLVTRLLVATTWKATAALGAVAVLIGSVGLTGSAVAGQAEERGSLVIIGGAARYTQSEIWTKIVELAGGEGKRIAVFPTASSDLMTNGSRTVDALREAGADAFLVPLWVENAEVDYRTLVADAKLIEEVRSANGVFFLGGSQTRITTALGSCETNRTPLLDAIWDVYNRGGVIAGSSAGAAVMSRTMFCQGRSVLGILQNGAQVGRELGPGLGFLGPTWFVEQHCLARGRFARTLVAMNTLGLKHSVGIDENTAVVVEQGRAMSVVGHSAAIVMDLAESTTDPMTKGFNLKGAKLSYLEPGDSIDLENLVVLPSPDKSAGQVIEPSSKSFQPGRNDTLITYDILGKSSLVELLCKLIENREGEAIGLAFDPALARSGPTSGFEFRFYRAADSRGWYSPTGGPGNYTIANIRLDVRPIEVTGPQYK